MELNENHADTLNLMGVVEMHLGEDQNAYDYFRKASGAKSSHTAARLNQAAIFVRYQDETRAKATEKARKAQNLC